jgi:GDP-D-mannose 3', 5'-epimerase
MEIVVTGHKGFIGKNIVKRLNSLGHSVIGLDYPEYDLRTCKIPAADAMIHLAANMGGVGFFTEKQFNPILDNMLMDARVIRHCQKHNMRMFYPSSACAYPLTAMNLGLELDELLLDSPYEPDQMYGFEKLFITKLSDYADFDLRVGVLHTIYGEGQEFQGKRAKFIPQICYKFATQKTIEVWGDGKQTRTFLHIDDAVEMILEVFFSDEYFGPVNISSSREVKISEVVKILSKLSGKNEIKYNESKPVGPVRRAVDMNKFYKHYDSRPLINLEKGIEQVFDYVKSYCDSSSVLS